MTLMEITRALDLDVASGRESLEREVSGGYASDLLSDVIANARKDNLWITLQAHHNVVAIATLRDLAGVIIVNGKRPDGDVIEKADAEGVPLLLTPRSAYETAGMLFRLGITGKGEE